MLYYYAEKSRLCLIRHSTIIFYSLSFVKYLRKSLVILPRYSQLYRGFFDTHIKEHMFLVFSFFVPIAFFTIIWYQQAVPGAEPAPALI